MILGMTTYTFVHVVISLLAITSGVIVAAGFLAAKRLEGVAAFFLVTTALTSLTGFGFRVDHFLPSHAIAIISLVVLAVAIYARYLRRLAGVWRSAYVIGVVTTLYLNVFVLIVQLFLRVPALKAAAPTQSELPFLLAQLTALVLFVVVGFMATVNFRAESSVPIRRLPA